MLVCENITVNTVLKSKKPSEISDVTVQEIKTDSPLGTIYVCKTKWENIIRFTQKELNEYFYS